MLEMARYDYYTLEYWTTLLTRFLDDAGDISALPPPPARAAYKASL